MIIEMDKFDYLGHYNGFQKIKQTINELTAIILKEPDNYEAYRDRAYNRQELGDYQGAIDDYTSMNVLAEKDKNYHVSSQAKNLLGTTNHEFYIFNYNVNAYTNIIEESDSIDSYLSRGKYYHLLGKYQEALADFNHVIQKEPDNINGYFRAIIYLELEDYQAAINDFNTILRLKPDLYYEIYLIQNKLREQIKLNEAQQFINNFSEHISKCGSPNFNESLAEAYLTVNKYQDAIEILTKILTSYDYYLVPYYIVCYSRRFQAYLALNDYQKAIKDLNEIIKEIKIESKLSKIDLNNQTLSNIFELDDFSFNCLREQQRDFIERFKKNLLLSSNQQGLHTELYVIKNEELKQLSKFSWKMVNKFKHQNTDSQIVFINNLTGKLGEEVVVRILGDLVNPVDYSEFGKGEGDGGVDLICSVDPQIKIQVKTRTNRTSEMKSVQWKFSQKEIQNNSVLVCILSTEDINESQREYNLIVAGFLPTEPHKLTESLTLTIEDLLYAGGLRFYIKSLLGIC